MSVTRSSPVVTKWVTITSVLMGLSPVQTVPACPVQIGAHHHIDVYTDINDPFQSKRIQWSLVHYQSDLILDLLTLEIKLDPVVNMGGNKTVNI